MKIAVVLLATIPIRQSLQSSCMLRRSLIRGKPLKLSDYIDISSRTFITQSRMAATALNHEMHDDCKVSEHEHLLKLEDLGSRDNILLKYLIAEDVPMKPGNEIAPRQVKKAHYTLVRPEGVPKPYFVAASRDCARMIGLHPTEIGREEFNQIFSGSLQIPGFDRPYATNYGCHSYGTWFGQNGDGRAISIGEVQKTKNDQYQHQVNWNPCYDNVEFYELQLKGAGRTPYSRGFDGRAVLRSCIREFLGKYNNATFSSNIVLYMNNYRI